MGKILRSRVMWTGHLVRMQMGDVDRSLGADGGG